MFSACLAPVAAVRECEGHSDRDGRGGSLQHAVAVQQSAREGDAHRLRGRQVCTDERRTSLGPSGEHAAPCSGRAAPPGRRRRVRRRRSARHGRLRAAHLLPTSRCRMPRGRRTARRRCRAARRHLARLSPRNCSSRRRSSRRTSSPARGRGSAASAYCSTLPPFMTAIRSEIDSASSWSWVTNTVVIPRRCWISRMSSRTRTRSLASRLDSGSSRSSTFGSSTSARASATRCCSPPEMRAG